MTRRQMSFRTRLTTFFVVIVVVPMAAVGILVFRLIDDSQQGKVAARASGLASAVASTYDNSSRAARFDAQTIARDISRVPQRALRARLASLSVEAGVARVVVTQGAQTLADVGSTSAIAPGVALVRGLPGHTARMVAVSEITARRYAQELAGPDFGVVVQQGPKTLGSSLTGADGRAWRGHGVAKIGNVNYQFVTQRFAGFGGSQVKVIVFSDEAATSGSVGGSQIVAGLFIAGFLLLAFCFSVLASRALQGQLGRFLEAARRLGSGDFSSPVPIEGHDEFAALGEEFNSMSQQLAHRLEELDKERARLRISIGRIGETFASNLDRPALLELALKSAIDAVGADRGRLSSRRSEAEGLSETKTVGSLTGLDRLIHEAERAALSGGGFGESAADEVNAASVALGAIGPEGRTHGLITVVRSGEPFTRDDRGLLRHLAAQATLALENVELHFQVRRQAVTDDLTGLATHGRFQERLATEMEEVRRYQYPVALIMLDIDDFKSVNDLYGHQQGDIVIRYVARALRQCSRDVDVAARYGGEELALILPHTELEGAFAIAERVRSTIETLQVPRMDNEGSISVTASLGVAASADGNKDQLIAAADNALYVAKHEGKNRTVRAEPQTANVLGGE